jgi:peptide/nickel transport system substrate-binding protein
MTIRRRSLLAAGAAALALPNIAQAQGSRVLRFMPHADPISLDPVWTTADITRNHGNMVYDQLFGVDENFQPHPQMVGGVNVSADGKTWELTLRPGLRFHDGEPVRAIDCITSIRRWWSRDSYGTVLNARTDELSAVDDKTIRFRLKQPFALLPEALAQPACVMMPERIAKTDSTVQITDPTGSGPFRFKADERVAGSRVVYEKFADYVPRPDGQTSFLAGPKVVHFDRVVWTFQPDPATAAAAMQKNEFDWLEGPSVDLITLLRRDKDLVLRIINRMGGVGCIRFNSLNPPFDNPAIRRLVMACVDQKDYAEAVSGAEPELYKTGVGLFTPGMPMATDVGVTAMAGRKDFDKVKQELTAAGYKGEKVVLLGPSTIPSLHAQSLVAADMLRRMGFNVDYLALEWGSVVQRRASKEPIDKGGWSIFITNLTSLNNVFVPAQIAIRSGPTAWFGWPDAPKLEELREAWLAAPDVPTQKRIVEQLQLQAFQDAPYVPTGFWTGFTCFNKGIKGIQNGWPVFWGVRRA